MFSVSLEGSLSVTIQHQFSILQPNRAATEVKYHLLAMGYA